jgi:hypothetical protein
MIVLVVVLALVRVYALSCSIVCVMKVLLHQAQDLFLRRAHVQYCTVALRFTQKC